MNTRGSIVLFVILSFIGLLQLHAQESSSRIAILPLHASGGIDTLYIQTAESILRTEIGKHSTMDIVSQKRTTDALEGSTCAESECALAVGKKLDASQVVGCQLSPLGEKIIVRYFLVSVSANRVILVDETTAQRIEDMESIMKRIAFSVVERKPLEKSAQVGNIVPAETTMSLRRMSRRNFGLSFGYLYPQAGYDNSQRSFVVDARFDYELDDYAVGMLIGARSGFAVNLYGSYLFSREDVCPYVGGAFGFHWVTHTGGTYSGYNFMPNNMKSDGFELTANAGLRVLHTYNFEMIFNLEYIYSMNDYNDRAVVFTIGIL